MKVAGLQTSIVWEQPDENHARLRPWLDAACAAGARLVVLPEMFACGFSMNTAQIAQPEDGPSTQFVIEEAKARSVWIGGSVPAKREGATRPANTFVLAGPDGQLHRYRKIHAFSFANEDEHYDAGDAFVTVEIDGLRVTLFVCYDLRFADEFWATAADTDAYLVVANWPERRRHHWTTLLRARAIENQAYVVGINRVGEGGGIDYSGDSRIIDPWGEILAGGAGTETMLLADVDPQVVADARRKFPVMADRR